MPSIQTHPEAAIVAEQLEKVVPVPGGPLTLLHGIDLRVPRGGSLAIVGPSGSGKTTLLGLLAGLDVPTRGTVRIDGVDLHDLDEDGRASLRAARIGFVFQDFQLIDHLSALENVMLALDIAGRSRRVRDDASAMLARVGLGARLEQRPSVLSGGEQQRVALARAFATQPALLLADEPTGNLAEATGARIIDLLFALQREHGTTLVLVTHDPALARRCDAVVALRDGRLQPPDDKTSS